MGFFSKKKSGNVKKEKEMGKLLNSRNLDENTKRLKERLKDCDDIVYKEFRVGEEQDLKFLLVYADGMSSRDMLNDAVLNALMVH
ncbi:MAG TPA: spore germination protein, partial [Sedimentibacter sp.]|nr:spore germination protein [Sedimentibacter sp.]